MLRRCWRWSRPEPSPLRASSAAPPPESRSRVAQAEIVPYPNRYDEVSSPSSSYDHYDTRSATREAASPRALLIRRRQIHMCFLPLKYKTALASYAPT